MALIDKPAGVTSHDVVATVRRLTGTRRVGHTGTLDPFATGLLVLLLGRATRLGRFLVRLDKEYHGVIELGVATETDDATGAVIARSEGWARVRDDEIQRVMMGFVGGYEQRPPVYSAKQVAGERAYRRARRGESIALVPRRVEVFAFELTSREGAYVRFGARVGSGTYLRALARDLGQQLGCGAHLAALRRTAVGSFSVRDAVPLAGLQGDTLPLRPPVEAVRHLPAVQVGPELARRLAHGQPVSAGATPAEAVAVLAEDGALLAVARRRGDMLRPEVVLAP